MHVSGANHYHPETKVLRSENMKVTQSFSRKKEKKGEKKKFNVRNFKESNIKQKRRLTLLCHHLMVMNP